MTSNFPRNQECTNTISHQKPTSCHSVHWMTTQSFGWGLGLLRLSKLMLKFLFFLKVMKTNELYFLILEINHIHGQMKVFLRQCQLVLKIEDMSLRIWNEVKRRHRWCKRQGSSHGNIGALTKRHKAGRWFVRTTMRWKRWGSRRRCVNDRRTKRRRQDFAERRNLDGRIRFGKGFGRKVVWLAFSKRGLL